MIFQQTIDQEFNDMYREIMENFQCIEHDLKRIYAEVFTDDYDDAMDMLETSNLGNMLIKFKRRDMNSDDPWFSEAEYEQLDRIREQRNYWAHQCFLDFVYDDDYQRARSFQKVANRLANENNQIRKLQRKIEGIYLDLIEE